jgi:hypothetical protein
LNKVHKLCGYYNKSYYTNDYSYTNDTLYLRLNSWEVLEFSQLGFEDEQLFKIGDQFKTDANNTIYTFSYRTGNTVFITWGTNGKTDYSLETCNKFLEKGDWVLIKKKKTWKK